MARRRSASTRYALRCSAFVRRGPGSALLECAFGGALYPHPNRPCSGPLSRPGRVGPAAVLAAARRGFDRVAGCRRRFDGRAVAGASRAVWGAGVVLRAGWLIAGLYRLRARADGPDANAIQSEAQPLQDLLRTRARIEWRADLTQPATLGLFPPRVLLPTALADDDAARRRDDPLPRVDPRAPRGFPQRRAGRSGAHVLLVRSRAPLADRGTPRCP